MVSFKRLRTLKKVSFIRHLITLPYHMMSSVSIGLDAGRTAVRLAGLATAVAIGTTTALTTTGSLIVSIVGGFVGVVAITVGIMGLAREHSSNTEKLKEIVGSENETGKDHQLKLELAKLISNANKLDQNKLGELLFVLQGIEGENITEKLCNLFDVEYNRSMDSMGGKFQVPQDIPTPQHLLGVKIIELLTGNKTEWRNVPTGIINNISSTNIIYNEHIQKAKKELALILNRSSVDSKGRNKFEYNIAKTTEFIEKITQLPGENLLEKIACLYGIDVKYSANMDELIKKIKEKELFLLNEIPVKFENIRHLNRVIKKMAGNTYMQILLLKSRDITPQNLEMIRLTKEFKKMLLLIEGDDYDQKLNAIFNISPFERSAAKFKEIALNHPNTKAALEKKPMLIENLLKAKKAFDADYSSVFFRPFTYLQDLFYAFSGSLTGFGIVTGIAAFVGVGIATSGVGLIILVAALASAVVGFTLAYLVQRYTRNYSKSFNKEMKETTDLTEKATAKAKVLNNELQMSPAPQPHIPQLQPVPTESLLHRTQFQLERENKALRDRLAQLELQNRELPAASPSSNSKTDEALFQTQQKENVFFPTSGEPTATAQVGAKQEGKLAENSNPNVDPTTIPEEEKAGEKRPAAKDPESPPPPTPKYSRGDDGNNNK